MGAPRSIQEGAMSGRSRWPTVVLAVSFLILAGCSAGGGSSAPAPTAAGSGPTIAAKPAEVPVLRLPGGDNGYPSPFAYVRGPGYVRMSLLFDTLVWKDSQGTIPWLATEWKSSEDGQRWTFTLRDGVRWQDGQPLTLDDVVFTFDYLKKQPASAPLARGLEYLGDVRALDTRQVEIALARPYAPFFVNIAGAIPILPRHIWEKIADPLKATGPETVIGSGPYKLIAYDKATGAYLYEANADFWLGRPLVRRIELVPTGDALLALQKGDVDAAGLPTEGGVTDEVLAPFQMADFGQIKQGGEWNPALHFNLAKGTPYSERNFRRAVAYAVDRDDLVKRILQGRGEPGNPGWLAPSNSWRNPAVEQYPFDPAKAKALLDEAGYRDSNGDGVRELPGGKPLDLPLLFDSNGFARVAELIRDMLKGVGVAVTLKPVDRATLDAQTAAGNYEAAITYYGGLGGDPDYMRQVFSSKSPSRSFQRAQGYSNPRFDDLAEQQLTTSDETRRKALVFEMQSIVAQDVPVLPLYYPTSIHIFRKGVLDTWYFTPGGIGSGVPIAWNKQAFVTGQPTGLKIRGQ